MRFELTRNGNIVEFVVMIMIAASIAMWFLEIDIQDVKDEYSSQTSKIQSQSKKIASNAERINEKAIRVLNENDELRKCIVDLKNTIEILNARPCECENSIDVSIPDPYGTGY